MFDLNCFSEQPVSTYLILHTPGPFFVGPFFVHLLSSFVHHVCFMLYRDAEEERDREFQAALKIQCWFRGTKVRAYLK